MPEAHVDVVWPDGGSHTFYSPSLVVEDYFAAGTAYPVEDFLRRSREATSR